MSRDNASQRVLQARATTVAHADSLTNTYGTTLPDGAQCWVRDRQHNYRFIKDSVLYADGELVVEPVDRQGRWVREAGLVGFAIVEDGMVPQGQAMFSGYAKQQLVQFALSADGYVIYTGAVPRPAFVRGSCDAAMVVGLLLEPATGGSTAYMQSTNSAQAMLLLAPGDKLSLQTSSVTDLMPALGELHAFLL